MGFKSTTNHSHLLNDNSNNNYKKGGLIFDSIEDYLLLLNLDSSLNSHVELIKNNCYNLEEFFNRFEKVNVRESYYNAKEELDNLFKNASKLLQYEGTQFITEYKVGCCFFDKINILEYIDSDDDSDDSDGFDRYYNDTTTYFDSDSDDDDD